jgi:hypothetical protein
VYVPKAYIQSNSEKPNKYCEFFEIMAAEIELIAALFPKSEFDKDGIQKMKDNLLIHLKVEKVDKNAASDIETIDLLELVKLLKYTAAVEMIDPLLLTSLCRLSHAMLNAL